MKRAHKSERSSATAAAGSVPGPRTAPSFNGGVFKRGAGWVAAVEALGCWQVYDPGCCSLLLEVWTGWGGRQCDGAAVHLDSRGDGERHFLCHSEVRGHVWSDAVKKHSLIHFLSGAGSAARSTTRSPARSAACSSVHSPGLLCSASHGGRTAVGSRGSRRLEP